MKNFINKERIFTDPEHIYEQGLYPCNSLNLFMNKEERLLTILNTLMKSDGSPETFMNKDINILTLRKCS